MAEISYPFNEANANGGSQIVSQTQWQAMARMWGGDRVDFQLTATTYGANFLPFNATIVNGRTVQINPGKAWVGGFYYSLTAQQSVTIANNSTTKPRKDLIVLQADMAKSAVNIAVLTGTAAASPVAPAPRRQAGGIWEMPLYEVDAAANNASISISSRMPFDVPGRVAYPWNTETGAALLPRGSFVYDMDNNGGDTQKEGFLGRDGYVVTRHLGKSRTYTPSMVNIGNPSTRVGRWRWIAPNTVWFSVYIASTSTSDLKVSSDNFTYGVTLPVPANGSTGQVFQGHMDNNGSGASPNLPNFVDLTVKTNRGSSTSTMYLYMPNKNYTTDTGLDGIEYFPRKGFLTISGVYEAAEL
ncbi:hypothetical protein ACFYO2_26580 [Streptomyces sp. NPDC006602]|uniref:hypothetical protein n=1 Tax=Streptomyces sp. NPDC006602 TaxID=3364751 RepID=UPI003683781A